MTEFLGTRQQGKFYIQPEKPSIPCTADKCLKYPVCKSKNRIICKDLLARYHSIELEGSWDAWGIMREYFPNLTSISPI